MTSSPGRFGCVEAVIGQVGLVHDPGHIPQHRVVQLEVAQHRLERAVSAVVRQLHPPHVERRRLRTDVLDVIDEHELGPWVHEPSQQPGTGSTVDVHPGTSGPPHVATTVSANRSTATRARSRSTGEKKSRRPIRCSSRRSRAATRRRTASTSPSAADAWAITAS